MYKWKDKPKALCPVRVPPFCLPSTSPMPSGPGTNLPSGRTPTYLQPAPCLAVPARISHQAAPPRTFNQPHAQLSRHESPIRPHSHIVTRLDGFYVLGVGRICACWQKLYSVVLYYKKAIFLKHCVNPQPRHIWCKSNFTAFKMHLQIIRTLTYFFFIYFFQTFRFYDHILQPFVQYNDIIHMFIEIKINKMLFSYREKNVFTTNTLQNAL